MNNSNPKIFISFFLILLVTNITCGNRTQQKEPVLISEEAYSPKTICDCNDDGMNILNDILTKRKEFETIELLTANEKASKHISLLKKNWKTTQYKCLRLFGPALLGPTECNQPKKIQFIKDQLFDLGVRT